MGMPDGRGSLDWVDTMRRRGPRTDFSTDCVDEVEPLAKSLNNEDELPQRRPQPQYRIFRCCLRCLYLVVLAFGLYVVVVFTMLAYHQQRFKRDPESLLYCSGSDCKAPQGIRNYILSHAGYRTSVPLWLQKNLAIPVPHVDKKICFVHVGKTAGSTLACKFGFLYPECAATEGVAAMSMAPGLLPAATTNLIHTSYNDCLNRDFDYYLFVLRDPLQRIQSWFNYEMPDTERWAGHRLESQKRLFDECNFHTLNALGENGLVPRRKTTSEEEDDTTTSDKTKLCQTRAYMAITGAVGYSTHNMYNFGYYLREVVKGLGISVPKNIVVIRTEHLEADWKYVEEELLHGPKDLDVSFSRKRNASPTRPDAIYLSDVAQTRICAALCKEIQIYKYLLNNSINLNKKDIRESLSELTENCPNEAVATDCEH